MSVENLVEWVVFWRAFVDDVQKLRLVLTFELKGGFYHVMFLVRFLLFFRAFFCGGLCVNLWSYPLSVRAFW